MDGMALITTTASVRKKNKLLACAVALAAVFGFAPARAQSAGTASDFWHRDTLTGDWDGERSALSDHGITFSMTYAGDLQANVQGGIQRGAVYDSLLQPQVDLDLQKLAGWQGTTARIALQGVTGPSLSTGYTGNLLNTSSIGGRPAFRLYDAWLQQTMFRNALSIRAGLMNADAEFFVSQTGSMFVNSTFGWPGILGVDLPGGGPAYPLSAPGVRVKLQPATGLALLAAVFSGDPTGHDGSNAASVMQPDGTLISFNGGVLAMTEADWSLNQGKDAAGLPVTFKFGGWYHSSAHFQDQRVDDDGVSLADPASNGLPRNHTGDWGFYGIVDTMLYRAPNGNGLSAFARVAATPAGMNVIAFYADGGLAYKGLLPGRQDDTLGVAVAFARIGSQARALDLDGRRFGDMSMPVRDQEIVLELSYQAQVTPWWTLQPDMQFIFNPGGHVANADGSVRQNALLLGLRTTVQF